MSDQRTAFELWAKEQGYDLTRGSWGERYMDDRTWVAYQGWSAAVGILRPASNDLLMRETAAALAHRGCCGSEHDPLNGKLHGYCVVCGVPWPCETAQFYLRRADKPETAAPVVQYDPVGFQYLYTDPFTGNDIWKNESGLWNSQKPHGSREVYARTQLRPAIAGDPS